MKGRFYWRRMNVNAVQNVDFVQMATIKKMQFRSLRAVMPVNRRRLTYLGLVLRFIVGRRL